MHSTLSIFCLLSSYCCLCIACCLIAHVAYILNKSLHSPMELNPWGNQRQLVSHAWNSQHFTELKISLPCSLEPTTVSIVTYMNPVLTNLTLFSEIHFIFLLPCRAQCRDRMNLVPPPLLSPSLSLKIQVSSTLNFLFNQILICYCHSKILELRYIFKGSISNPRANDPILCSTTDETSPLLFCLLQHQPPYYHLS
jgi:hypothetical protein